MPSGMDNIVEIAKFFNSGENITRMKELADKEAEVDGKLNLLGGVERAKDLIAEADEIRRQADMARAAILKEATVEADRLRAVARTELATAESTRRRAVNEFQAREERVEALERDITKRLRAIEQDEARLKSGQEKLRLAEKEVSDLRDRLQGKLAALKKLAGE